MLLKLVDVPAGTKFRNMMLKIPGAPFSLEATEFSGMEFHPVKPRIQDPGAAVLSLTMDDVDAALETAKKNGAVVVTTGGAPSAWIVGERRGVIVKDPDGYYVELSQASGKATGRGKVVDAAFGSVIVQDAVKAASFYRDQFGFAVKTSDLPPEFSAHTGTAATRIRYAAALLQGTNLFWTFVEFNGVDRKSYTPRIPDPGAPAIGLQVRDIDAAIAAVKAAGGSSITAGGSLKLGSGKVGFVRDPSGILVELAQ
jgi:predicted enzyme related to lactoylglutathione lyase